jgi:hypothetical protein
VDRIRAFRRRHESPSDTPNLAISILDKTRARSPGWRGKMEALRSSTKRAHSATPPPDNSVPQVDGACLGKPDAAGDAAPPAKAVKAGEAAASLEADNKPSMPTMPFFLRLEEAGRSPVSFNIWISQLTQI